MNRGNPYNGWTSTDRGEVVLSTYYGRVDTLFLASGVFRYWATLRSTQKEIILSEGGCTLQKRGGLMPEVMNWYNPTTGRTEDADAPMSEAQAIEMLSGHPNSGEFIAEYQRKRMSSGVVEALISTGEFFYREYMREQSPE